LACRPTKASCVTVSVKGYGNQGQGHASEERQRLARQQQQLKEAALKQLETVEKQAKDWQRAQLLRSYAESIADQGGPSESVAWIQNAADWLDPMTRKHWPDVDGTVLKGRPEQ
jgi:hypothetical protein